LPAVIGEQKKILNLRFFAIAGETGMHPDGGPQRDIFVNRPAKKKSK
jgi:hypothetical protein